MSFIWGEMDSIGSLDLRLRSSSSIGSPPVELKPQKAYLMVFDPSHPPKTPLHQGGRARESFVKIQSGIGLTAEPAQSPAQGWAQW